MRNDKVTYENLTDIVRLYKAGLISYEKISGYIALYIYDYPRRVTSWDEDKCDSFFEFIHPMIKTFTNKFICKETLFKDYIVSCIRPFMQIFDEKF